FGVPALQISKRKAKVKELVESNDLERPMINLLKALQGNLQEPLRTELLQLQQQFETIEIVINTLPSQMKYDQFLFQVPTGAKLRLIFNNPDMMPHNLVIVTPGSLEKVGKAADQLVSAQSTDNYVPDMPEVLIATPIVDSGQTYELVFRVPETPGNYPFVCTYPGHWPIMNGIMEVVSGVAEATL
ncbi:MAG: plastocyanin/azurin family copper-binding protein, partial [Bacteroidota bacterium]